MTESGTQLNIELEGGEKRKGRRLCGRTGLETMDSSDEDDDFSYHEGITPQSKINSLYQSNTEKVFSLVIFHVSLLGAFPMHRYSLNLLSFSKTFCLQECIFLNPKTTLYIWVFTVFLRYLASLSLFHFVSFSLLVAHL